MFSLFHETTAQAGGVFTACLSFWLGYLLILVVPGPNMLAIGVQAAVHGLRAALTLALAISFGAGLLLAIVHQLVDQAGSTFRFAIAICSVILLFYCAWRMAFVRPAASQSCRDHSFRSSGARVLLGLACGFANPITAAYFATNAIKPEGPLFQQGMVIPLAVSAMLLSASTMVTAAAIFSRAAMRQRLIDCFPPLKFFASGVIAGHGLSTASKLMSSWSAIP